MKNEKGKKRIKQHKTLTRQPSKQQDEFAPFPGNQQRPNNESGQKSLERPPKFARVFGEFGIDLMMAIKWRENQQRDLNKERIQKIFRGKKIYSLANLHQVKQKKLFVVLHNGVFGRKRPKE
jgi:hypothetical protein